MSGLLSLYVIAFIGAIHAGYKAALGFSSEILTVFIGCISGLAIGIISLLLMLLGNKLVWVRVQQRQNESKWAIIGIIYFLFCIIWLIVTYGISSHTSKILITLIQG